MDEKTFDSWAESNSDFSYPIQYYNQTLIISIVLPPNDQAGGIIMHSISREVHKVCYPTEPEVYPHTGCMSLT